MILDCQRPSHDHGGNRICGQDFMAGTICTDSPNHFGAHSCRCQVCDGDWMNGTCICEIPNPNPDD